MQTRNHPGGPAKGPGGNGQHSAAGRARPGRSGWWPAARSRPRRGLHLPTNSQIALTTSVMATVEGVELAVRVFLSTSPSSARSNLVSLLECSQEHRRWASLLCFPKVPPSRIFSACACCPAASGDAGLEVTCPRR